MSEKFKLLIDKSIAEEGIDIIRYAPNFDVILIDKKERVKIESEISNAHGIIVRSGIKVTDKLLTNAKSLRIVGRAGGGYDNIDVNACSSRGIAVLIATGANTNGVIELTIGLMLSLIRDIPKADNSMKQGKWAKKSFMGTELKGKKVGLIGLGRIGLQVAKICNYLGMDVFALVRNKNKRRKLSFKLNLVENLEELLPLVDILTIHAPLNAETKGMIGEKELALMKPSAFLINTARGGIVDEKALQVVLREKKLQGAAIDVYSKEPATTQEFPFIKYDNCITLPHLGGNTLESQVRVSKIICKNVMEALENEIFIDTVNLPFSIPREQARTYRPFIKLAKALGIIAGQYYNQHIKAIKIYHHTRKLLDLKPILMTLYKFILNEKNSAVSFINIEDFIKENKIHTEIHHDHDHSVDNSLKLEIIHEDDSLLSVKGTFVAKLPKILEIQNIHIEIVPSGKMVLIKSKNIPGIIGKIGTLLGDNGINITELHMGRTKVEEKSMGALVMDQILSQEVREKLTSIKGVISVHPINFG
ncbi:MAG: phosphoglycerate dehydrogenase [Promethearchaeota archaeon]